jgi:predicted AAA+ superfamily ATPase
MDRLYKTYGRLLAETDLSFTRYLYEKINWDNRLIVIKGAKGVGKTTMLLQHILRTFEDKQKALYASVINSLCLIRAIWLLMADGFSR